MRIGPYTLASRFLLAPMAGVTDATVPAACAGRLGAGMAASEMVTADISRLWQHGEVPTATTGPSPATCEPR